MLLSLFVIRVFAATATELAKLQPVGFRFLILGRDVVAALALVTLKDNIIARHFLIPDLCSLVFVLGSLFFVF
jgi:hypothetical protein